MAGDQPPLNHITPCNLIAVKFFSDQGQREQKKPPENEEA
jgi:hypothetical protein